MLEEIDSKPVTTAALANEVGVSEAALYRHFPSKGRMYRGLIEFIERMNDEWDAKASGEHFPDGAVFLEQIHKIMERLGAVAERGE